MKKNYNIIYIWSFIILIGFFLILLYTPIVDNFNHSSVSTYNIINTTVDFKTLKIYSPKQKNTKNTESEDNIPNNDIFKIKISKLKTKKTQLQYYNDYNIIETNNINSINTESNFSLLTTNGKKSNSKINYSDYSITDFLNSTTNNKVPFDNLGNGVMITDPGGDPIGQPIPIGNGFFTLLLLSFFYIIYKKILIYNK